jgi:hypothetical protein
MTMAEANEATENAVEEQTDGSSESNGGTGRTALRAAAIAAASGATAIAARKALSSRSGSGDEDDEQKSEGGSRKQKGGSGGDSVLSTALNSGWDSARDSVVPMLGNAAAQAGEYVARSGPELLRETIVPQFIRGFERASESSDDD